MVDPTRDHINDYRDGALEAEKLHLEGIEAALVSHIEKLESEQIQEQPAGALKSEEVEYWWNGEWRTFRRGGMAWPADVRLLVRKRKTPTIKDELTDFIQDFQNNVSVVTDDVAEAILESFDVKRKGEEG